MYDLNLIDPVETMGESNLPPISSSPIPQSSAPSNLMYSSMGLSAIGAIATAFESSKSIRAQGDYEASIARTNATIAGIQAKQAIQEGDVAASRKDMETQQTVGALRASQGASGVDVNVGSPAAARAGVAGVGAIDELTIRNNAARQAWGYQTEAIEDTYKGQFAQLTAKSQSDQSLLNGGLQAISGPLGIESNYLRWSRYMGGGSGGQAQRLPFNLSTN